MTEKTTRSPTATVDRALSTEDNKPSNQSLPPRKIKKNTKTDRVLKALMSRSYNRFEAERDLHDHALNSTVSNIQIKHGIRVDRCSETVPGYQGAPTTVSRYWISVDQREKCLIAIGESNV